MNSALTDVTQWQVILTLIVCGLVIFVAQMITKPIIKSILDLSSENAEFSGQITAINKSQAVIQFNMDMGTIIIPNDMFLKAMGYGLPEIQGKHHSLFVAPGVTESNEYRQFWETLNRGEFDKGEYKRIGKGGKEVWLQATYNPIMDLTGKPVKVVKYATDVTELKLSIIADL